MSRKNGKGYQEEYHALLRKHLDLQDEHIAALKTIVDLDQKVKDLRDIIIRVVEYFDKPEIKANGRALIIPTKLAQDLMRIVEGK